MNKSFLIFITFLASYTNVFNVSAQSLPVGFPLIEDYYRRAQLLGRLNSSISFSSRPFFPLQALGDKNVPRSLDSLLNPFKESSFGHLTFGGSKGKFDLLPITWQQQYNSHHPEGINDGSMIPSRGYQTLISAGVFAKYGPLSIQLKPELVYASNKPYNGFATTSGKVWADYYNSFLNKIDLPEKFGENVYSKLLWGQSSIRLTFGWASLGISSENLWFGPGMRNSLLMSNSAEGFEHITFNTVRPVRTIIGSFEGQLIAGRLNSSKFLPPEPERIYLGQKLYIAKPNDWRYINAGVLTYQPKWIPGLFLGVTRSFYLYRNDMGNGLTDYLPVALPFEKQKADNVTGNEDLKKRDQLASLFARWIFLQEHAEVYLEYGRNDHAYNSDDFIMEPEHSRAYIFGLRKLFLLKKSERNLIQLDFELTQLELNLASVNRPAESWYSHYQVRDGYTNKGQLIGAGIGPGSNMQSFDVSWQRNLKMIGFQLERVVHNNDFHYQSIKDLRRHWVDLGFSLRGQWAWRNVIFDAKLKSVKSINYQHMYDPKDVNNFWDPGKSVFNFKGQLGLMYSF